MKIGIREELLQVEHLLSGIETSDIPALEEIEYLTFAIRELLLQVMEGEPEAASKTLRGLSPRIDALIAGLGNRKTDPAPPPSSHR